MTNFFPTVVETLGYDDIPTLLLTAPPYVLAVITTFINARHADKSGERYLHITLPLWISVIAFIIAASTTGTAPRYVAIMLMPGSFYAGYVVALAWISNSIPRPPAKRAAALAGINAISNASSIYSVCPLSFWIAQPICSTNAYAHQSYLYQGFMAPRYIAAFSVNCVTCLIAIMCATLLRIILVRLNKKLDRGEYVEGAVVGDGAGSNDQAAKQGFRFLV